MKFSIKDFFSKCDQIRSFPGFWLHSSKKSLTENFIFCAVLTEPLLLVILRFRANKIVTADKEDVISQDSL